MRVILKCIPYFIVFCSGILFFHFSSLFASEKTQSLFINVSASFLIIPLLYIIYEESQKIIHRKLNKEIFEYAKYLVDKEIVSILNTTSKVVFPYGKASTMLAIKSLPYMKQKDVEILLRNREFLGFQIFKHWEEGESYFSKLLENSFILSNLEDEQIIIIIKMVKAMRNFQEFCLNTDNFLKIECKKQNVEKEFAILDLKYAHRDNLRYPERLILLRKIDKEKGIVVDFGDFKEYMKAYLLNKYKVKEDKLKEFSKVIYNLLNLINRWLSLTGDRLLIDERKFRIRPSGDFKEVEKSINS